VKAPPPPRLEERRAAQFADELLGRARAWIPSWAADDGQRDFGRALLQIAARFSSEVAERLDRVPEKMRRGFLDWLGVRGKAARPARMPVVFKLADAARTPVAAPPLVQLQASAGDANVVFETETDVRLIPGRLQVVVGVDGAEDAFYLPPPGLSDLQPLDPLPAQWQLKSFAAAGATTLQLDPEAGLVVDMIIEAASQQYRITKVDKEIVTVDPPLSGELPALTPVRKITAFAAFDGITRDRQEHALYLGDTELLDIEAAATIGVVGAQGLRSGVKWQYWGKVDPEDDVDWQTLTILPEDQQAQADAVLLSKKRGAVVPLDIDGKNSRWIRAVVKNLAADQEPFRPAELGIRVNAQLCGSKTIPCPDDNTESPASEALANTAPLVLNSAFLPLGREPRQFDAFYLGSKEVFSKNGAEVALCFKMADPTFEALVCTRTGAYAHQVLAGVARDGHLHLLGFDDTTGVLSRYDNRGPVRPPSPVVGGGIVAGPPVSLDPDCHPAVWSVDQPLFSNFFAAVSSGDKVWIWCREGVLPAISGWSEFGVVQPVNDSTEKVAALVHLDDGAAGFLFAVRDGTLFHRDINNPNATWLETKDTAGNAIQLQTIAPVNVQNVGIGPGTLAEGLVGVDSTNTLFSFTFSPAIAGTRTLLLNNIDPTVAPAAVRRSDHCLVVVAVDDTQTKLQGFLSNASQLTMQSTDHVDLYGGTIGDLIDVNSVAGELTFVLSLQTDPQSTALARWTPFDPSLPDTLFTAAIPASSGGAAGAPTLLPKHLIIPAVSSRVLVATFDPTLLLTLHVPIEAALIAAVPADQLALNDSVAIPTSLTHYALETVTAAGITRGSETLYEFNVNSINGPVFVYRASSVTTTFTASVTTLSKLTLPTTDVTTGTGTILFLPNELPTAALHTVTNFNSGTHEAIISPPLGPGNPLTTIDYQVPETSGARLVPLLRLTAATGNWPASLLASTFLIFPAGNPSHQHGTAFIINNGQPVLVALGKHWTASPPPYLGPGAELLVDGTVGDWIAQLGDTSSNPDLSWEYGNGTGWWKLDPLQDETANLKQSGAVRFTVPDDLRPSDWAGRTNFWIRARLTGGDYGQEKVTATSTTSGNTTTQTIARSTEGIRAPNVLSLQIAYRLCDGVLPLFVLAEDSGSTRDQSDANRTRGAVVEAFVPLATALGRLSGAGVTIDIADDCPPPCQCPGEYATEAFVPATGTTATAPAPPLDTGRALFIGLDATPSGAPVNVLLLVDKEAQHDQFAPMKVDALAADRLVPAVANDTTRALGESGLLSMDLAVPPTPREMFGFENLTWLRLTPAAGGSMTDWKPAIRGAYLNAVWASAAETLTRELLGSSDGAPNLTVRVQRPPVLGGSLELRVREPLGDEEREALRKDDPNRVVADASLPGDWVLWEQVVDPGDEDDKARVYALDESIGEVRFGDGQHGMIPPIGRDSIVAFSYRRTEIGGTEASDVPGNAIAARTALNLVSPVESVEAVFAADQAAGGAPPESDDRVVRFGAARLRHRSRAITASDFEDLALESSPDIVQARCFARPGYVRLVVVMRGENPLPNAAQVRELKRLLLDAAPASLSAPDALRVTGPNIRRLRVIVELRVATLDHAGEVSGVVQQRISNFFDTAAGGGDGDGWPLGATPSENDVAYALLGTPHLESIGDVTLSEILPDKSQRPWTGAAKRDDLVVLDDDGVRLSFQIVEVIP